MLFRSQPLPLSYKSVSLIFLLHNDIPLAFFTRLIIFCIFSPSYGKVDSFDVKLSLISTLSYLIEMFPQAHGLTYATMYQHPQEFVIDIKRKSTAVETRWIE